MQQTVRGPPSCVLLLATFAAVGQSRGVCSLVLTHPVISSANPWILWEATTSQRPLRWSDSRRTSRLDLPVSERFDRAGSSLRARSAGLPFCPTEGPARLPAHVDPDYRHANQLGRGARQAHPSHEAVGQRHGERDRPRRRAPRQRCLVAEKSDGAAALQIIRDYRTAQLTELVERVGHAIGRFMDSGQPRWGHFRRELVRGCVNDGDVPSVEAPGRPRLPAVLPLGVMRRHPRAVTIVAALLVLVGLAVSAATASADTPGPCSPRPGRQSGEGAAHQPQTRLASSGTDDLAAHRLLEAHRPRGAACGRCRRRRGSAPRAAPRASSGAGNTSDTACCHGEPAARA
jgi:hypothetical protein